MKEKNRLKEKKLSNISYYFPFKDKNSTSSKMKKALQLGIKILSLDEAYGEFNFERKQ